MSIMQRLQPVTGGEKQRSQLAAQHRARAEAHRQAAHHHGKLVELNSQIGRRRAAAQHREEQQFHHSQAEMYAGMAHTTHAGLITAEASDEYNLHEHLQKLGYRRRQSQQHPETLTKQGRALTRKPATVALHRYHHAEALAGKAHKALHAHLMGAGFIHRAGKTVGYHHYRQGGMHLTIAPHSAGGHRVRFYHRASYSGKL
jgi:hypothetical protein